MASLSSLSLECLKNLFLLNEQDVFLEPQFEAIK